LRAYSRTDLDELNIVAAVLSIAASALVIVDVVLEKSLNLLHEIPVRDRRDRAASRTP